ncbi:hypothetical protein SCA6_002601 [Theobroma cacao]
MAMLSMAHRQQWLLSLNSIHNELGTLQLHAQPRITRPLPFVLFSKPSSNIHFSTSFDVSLPLITQINGLFDASKPKPSSMDCEGITLERLPRQA